MNAQSGGGRARGIRRRVEPYLRHLGFYGEIAEPRSADELRRQARAAVAAGFCMVAVLGGDGTFQQLVRATLGSNITLGLIPAGAGNDVAAALGIPADPAEAVRVLMTGAPRPLDIVRARFETGEIAHYVGGGGLGLDAESARLANGRLRRVPGAARYIAGALWALATFRPYLVEAELDGQRLARAPALLTAVANTPTYGAGIRIAPGAAIDDGELDVVFVEAVRWTRLVEMIPVMLQTGDIRGREIRRYRARRVRLEADRPTIFHGDGELLGVTPVEIECLPGAVRVIAPPAP